MNTVKFVNHINSERQYELFLARDCKEGFDFMRSYQVKQRLSVGL